MELVAVCPWNRVSMELRLSALPMDVLKNTCEFSCKYVTDCQTSSRKHARSVCFWHFHETSFFVRIGTCAEMAIKPLRLTYCLQLPSQARRLSLRHWPFRRQRCQPVPCLYLHLCHLCLLFTLHLFVSSARRKTMPSLADWPEAL